MKVRFIYSACIEIHTNDVSILTDPWFTEGAYDGSWYHFPAVDDPLEIISEPDVIYISHIHPDHYDPVFLKKLFEKWGEKPVLIPDFESNYLHLRSQFDGISTTPTKTMTYGDTQIQIVPNITGSVSDIDSAVFVKDRRHSVLNLNDCIWSDDHVKLLQSLTKCLQKPIDLLALGFTGAGPYPQTYFDLDTEIEIVESKAEKKKLEFFERYRRFCSAFPSKYHLPFAGQYILGGNLSNLNQYRGVADAFEITQFDKSAIVLADHGEGVIDLGSQRIPNLRNCLYDAQELSATIEQISKNKMTYENEILVPFHKINFGRLLKASYLKAKNRSTVTEDYYFVIEATGPEDQVYRCLLNANPDNHVFEVWSEGTPIPEPHSYITIDYRYLYGLLTGIYHWNNADVGSHLKVRRRPDMRVLSAQRFLHFLSAC